MRGLLLFFAAFSAVVSLGYGVARGLRPQPREISVVMAPVATAAHAASAEAKTELANIFVQISKKMIPSVVNIFTTATVRMPWSGREGGGPDDHYRRF